MSIVAGLLATLVAALATAALTRSLLPTFPLRRENYRGLCVTTGLGIAAVFGVISGTMIVALAASIWPLHFVGAGIWIFPLAAMGGFGALGLLDDVVSASAHGPEHGFGGHVRALASGHLTSGGIKMLVGGALAFVIAVPLSGSFLRAVAGAGVIALSANLLNCFDLRPGRGMKMFLLAAAPLIVLAGPVRGVLLAGVGSAIGFLPFDLRERAMCGDAGANAFGALLGACMLPAAGPGGSIFLLLAVLVVLQIVAEVVTFSRIFDAVPFLRAFDRWGSARSAPEPARSSGEAPAKVLG